jgi:hypothetical protein
MTGPVPPPLAPAAVAAVDNQPFAESLPGQTRAGGPPIDAIVVEITRQGPLIEADGQRFLISGAPPLPEGAGLSLELSGAGRQAPARLLSVAGRALEPPLAIRLLAAPAATPRGSADSGARPLAGVEVGARLLGPSGRPAGPPIAIRLAAIGDLAPDPPGPVASSGRTVTAEVVRADPTGSLLLRAPGLTLRLETAVDVPAGARLQLALPAGFLTGSVEPPSAAGGDALRRVIHALLRPAASADPGDAGGLRLPTADHALAARLLRWIDALEAGAGPAAARPGADTEAQGTGSEAGALRGALHELAQQARASQPGGWRVLVMPFGAQAPIPLRLYVRDPAADQERAWRAGRERRSGARRAIFAVDFSELGCCQLDVLCQARRFDLAVRTERPLAAGLQDEIRGLFGAACEIGGVAGTVEFRAEGLLDLPEPPGPAGHTLMA